MLAQYVKKIMPYQDSPRIKKELLNVMFQHKMKIILLFFLKGIKILIVATGPLLWGYFIESLMKGDSSKIQLNLILLCVQGVLIGVLSYIEGRAFSVYNNSCYRLLSEAINKKVIDSKYHIFEKLSNGSIISRMNMDVYTVIRFISQDLFSVILSLFSILIYGVILTSQSPLFLLVTIFICLFTYGLNCFYGKKNRSLMASERESFDEYNNTLCHYIGNFMEIKSFGLESLIRNKISKELSGYEKIQNRFSLETNRQEFIVDFITTLGDMGYLLLGYFFITQHWMSLGIFIAIYGYSNALKRQIDQISNTVSKLLTSKIAFDRLEALISEIYENENKIYNSVKIDVQKDSAQSLTLENISFGYSSESLIIDNQTMCFKKGKVYALVGKNGSGKSSLLKVIRGLYPQLSGDIKVDDIDIKCLSDDSISKLMIMSCQEGCLFEDTLLNNIKLDGEAKVTKAKYLIEQLKLKENLDIEDVDHHRLSDRGGNISGGQRQLVNFARVMYSESPILLLDEVTSALDATKKNPVIQLIKEAQKNKIIIMATHDEEIVKMADEVLFFDGNGTVKNMGKMTELDNGILTVILEETAILKSS